MTLRCIIGLVSFNRERERERESRSRFGSSRERFEVPSPLARHQTRAVRADDQSGTQASRGHSFLPVQVPPYELYVKCAKLCVYTITASAGDLGEFGPVRGRRGGVRGRVTPATGRASAAYTRTLPTTFWAPSTLGGGHRPRSDRDLGIDTLNNTLAFQMMTPARVNPLTNVPVAMATDGGLSPAASTAAPSDLLNLDTSPQKRGRVDQPATLFVTSFEGNCRSRWASSTTKSGDSKRLAQCAWKGRRLAFFACGAFEPLLRDAMSNFDIAVLGHLLSRNTAAASRIASISDQCNKVFTTVVLQKIQYTQELPWVFCATFAGYMGRPWHRVKELLKKHIQTVDLLIKQGQVTSLDDVTHELFGPTTTGRELREFVSSAADTPLHRWPHLFRVAQEYAFVSMSERHTEREHVGVKVAANRGLTKAGPAIVCCRKRKDQVLEMIENEQDLTFLTKHWRARNVLNQLLSHQLSPFEVSRLLPQQRWARLYGYAEEDHFKDVSDNARAEAIYRQAVRDQAAALGPPCQLPSASFQVMHWLKGHLATGTFFSVSKATLQRLEGTASEESPAPQNSFPTEALFRALKADVQPW